MEVDVRSQRLDAPDLVMHPEAEALRDNEIYALSSMPCATIWLQSGYNLG
jgi:hypothetical protein